MRLLSLALCLLAAGIQAAVLPSSPFGPLRVLEDALIDQQDTEAATAGSYWMADMPKQGLAAFNANPKEYKVWRNVKDYGAVGDGVHDDSDAINKAIQEQNRCGPWVCQSSTDTPAVVYIPPGTYLIGKPIIVWYNTQLIGDLINRPVLKAAPTLDALALIDGSPYNTEHRDTPGWMSTNLFARQIRNLEIDLRARDPTLGAQAIHWPASQATTIQNVKIRMTKAPNSVHVGIFIENGSGGHMTDIVIDGGLYGMNIGNQQFTMKNIQISNAVVGIYQIWNWGWLYKDLTISDCSLAAISMNNTNTSTSMLQVGSAVIIDSKITNCPTFVTSAWTTGTTPKGAGQLILENIALNNVPVAVRGSSGSILQGGTTTIQAWGQGNKYTPDAAGKFQGSLAPVKRPAGLLDGNIYYSRSKPQYETLGVDSFISARSSGAKGDGTTDDTKALQAAIDKSASDNKVLYLDHGVYKVTNMLFIPARTRITGETYPVIMASGNTWSSYENPVPVIQIGKADESGHIELSDFIVGTQGATPGAVLIEWNLATDKGSGLWDVHTRIGGAKGTNLQVAQCPTMTQKPECMAAYMNVHVTKSATGAYMENNWFWTADHDLDDSNSTRVSIFTGRGLLVEASNVWLYANGVEHHALYQYQFANAKDIFAGFIQTETPYWQPSPDAKTQPYPLNSTINDPDYNTLCPSGICDSFGLRILNSQNVLLYGAGIYSFFKNYDVSCSSPDAPNGRRDCQNQIVSIEGTSSGITAYALSEVGALQMLTIDKKDKASWEDNLSVYSNTIGLVTYNV